MALTQDEEAQGKKRRRGAALDDDADDDSDFEDLQQAKAAGRADAKSVRRAGTEAARSRGNSSAGRTAGGRSLGARTSATARGGASQHSGDRWEAVLLAYGGVCLQLVWGFCPACAVRTGSLAQSDQSAGHACCM